jgi:hypothetical protein
MVMALSPHHLMQGQPFTTAKVPLWFHWIDTILERFRAKWIPVRVKKTRQNKKIERGRNSIQSERALSAAGLISGLPILLTR